MLNHQTLPFNGDQILQYPITCPAMFTTEFNINKSTKKSPIEVLTCIIKVALKKANLYITKSAIRDIIFLLFKV